MEFSTYLVFNKKPLVTRFLTLRLSLKLGNDNTKYHFYALPLRVWLCRINLIVDLCANSIVQSYFKTIAIIDLLFRNTLKHTHDIRVVCANRI